MHAVGHNQRQIPAGIAANKQNGRQLLALGDLAQVALHLGVAFRQRRDAGGANDVFRRMDFDLGFAQLCGQHFGGFCRSEPRPPKGGQISPVD